MIPIEGKIEIESGADALIFGSFDENNQIVDTHVFGQGYIPSIAFYNEWGGNIMITMQNEDNSTYQDCYINIFRIVLRRVSISMVKN